MCSSSQKSIDVDTTASTTASATTTATATRTAARSGAKRSENPATAMSPMLFESARAAVSISRTNARSCHTLSPRLRAVRGGTSLPADRCRRCRRNAMARGVVPQPQSTERTTTVCIPHGRNRCVHVPACTRTSYGSSVTTRHRHKREAAAALRVREYARVCAYSGWGRGAAGAGRREGEREWNGDEDRRGIGERDRQGG